MNLRIIFIHIVLIFGLYITSYSQILNVIEVTQEQDNWCWAGSSACVIDYYCIPTQQCSIAEYTRTVATWHYFGPEDCCIDPTQGCDYWNYLYGYDGSVQDILNHFASIISNGIPDYLSQSTIHNNLSDNRPFVIRWGWPTGGGHFLVGHGLVGTNLYYMDPWYGEGYKIADYSWVVSAPGHHEWTHSLEITTPSPRPYPAESINGLQNLIQGQVGVPYTTSSITNATSYVWSLDPAIAGTIVGTGTSVTLNLNQANSGMVTMSVRGQNSCGLGAISETFNITVSDQQYFYEAAYSISSPTINGQITTSEWENANSYDITFYRTDGGDTHTGKIYLQHNKTWLYVGVESGWNSGWDVYGQLRFDGNNDKILLGRNSEPHIDIQNEYPSPGAWGGYNNYQYIVGTNTPNTTPPTGSLKGSNGSSNVHYEFNLKLSYLNLSLDSIFGFFIMHGSDGTTPHNYEFPLNGIKDNASLWTTVHLEEIIPWPCCPGIPTVDHGGQTYSTVQIDDQCWLRENLNIGIMINGSLNQTNNSLIEKYCYDNEIDSCNKYGGLYQWDEMMQYSSSPGSQGICPSGWHIPTDEEWKTLEGTVDSQYGVGDPVWNGTGYRGFDAGKVLKSTVWWNDNGNGTDDYGFTGVPIGHRFTNGSFLSIGDDTDLWSSNAYWRHTLNKFNDNIDRQNDDGYRGFTVRCVKEAGPTVPSNQKVQDSTINSGEVACFNAVQKITIAGNNTTFTLNSGGTATFIAGQKIQFLPGTTVHPGSSLEAYISTTGHFCGSLNGSMVMSTVLVEEINQKDYNQNSLNQLFKVYPNPTTGQFYLDPVGYDETSSILVEIYAIYGNQVLREELTGRNEYEFTLESEPEGVYLIRIVIGTKTETIKLIKQ